MELFAPDFWHWWILAVVMIILEILTPAFFALWIGVAAFITGLIVYFMPEIEWEYQVFMFALLSVVNIIVWKLYYKKNPLNSDEPLLNRRGEQYVGRIITLQVPIEDGQGKVKVDDSTWKIEGEDCPAGTKVRIVRVKNVVFQVEIVQ